MDMWTTPKKRCPHAHSPNKCNAKEGHISTKEQRRAHLTPEATSSASAEPGHPQILLRRQFEMAVNLKTAKALGLAVPPSILLRADEVIE